MKRLILAVIAAAFFIMGCSTDGGSNEPQTPSDILQGKWHFFSTIYKGPRENHYYEFKGNTWKRYCNIDNSVLDAPRYESMGGTFTCTENTITLTTTYYNDTKDTLDDTTPDLFREDDPYPYTIGPATFWPDYEKDPNDSYTYPTVLRMVMSLGSIGGPGLIKGK